MASIGQDPNGRKRILFVAGDGKRRTIRLGKVSQRQVEAFKVKIEALVGRGITGAVNDEVTCKSPMPTLPRRSRSRKPRPATPR